MKKLKVFVVAVCLLIVANETNAQKIGYIDAETVLYLMPETAKIDSLVRIYQTDTVGKEFNSLLQTYQYKDSLYRDSAHPMPAAVKEQYGKDLAELSQTLQNWQQIAQEAVQAKQSQLIQPVYKKIYDAISAVAKEKGYTYVLSKESVLIGPDGDNMLPAVAQKLKISVPPQLMPGYKAPATPAIK
jgi:outer membrane protein